MSFLKKIFHGKKRKKKHGVGADSTASSSSGHFMDESTGNAKDLDSTGKAKVDWAQVIQGAMGIASGFIKHPASSGSSSDSDSDSGSGSNIDLSGIQLPTVKTDVGISPNVLKIGGFALVAFLILSMIKGGSNKSYSRRG